MTRRTELPISAQVPGTVRAGVELLGDRPAIVARSTSGRHRGALTANDGETVAQAARLALAQKLPLVLVVSTSGSDVSAGIDALHGWGKAAAAVAKCSGSVPVLAAVAGPALAGPSLLLGIADITAMTPESFAYMSGPSMVREFTGVSVGVRDLGGTHVHVSSTGLCSLQATDAAHAMDLLADALS